MSTSLSRGYESGFGFGGLPPFSGRDIVHVNLSATSIIVVPEGKAFLCLGLQVASDNITLLIDGVVLIRQQLNSPVALVSSLRLAPDTSPPNLGGYILAGDNASTGVVVALDNTFAVSPAMYLFAIKSKSIISASAANLYMLGIFVDDPQALAA